MQRTFEILPYTPDMREDWDTHVRTSRNGTFLAERGYMEYHSDRFIDASMIALKKGKIAALLPACLRDGGVLSSHAGLTYGGWILPKAHLDGAMLLELFEGWREYCRTQGVKEIDYKPIPYIYTAMPSQEELYALWRSGFTQSSVNLSSAVDMRGVWKFNMSKRQQTRKAMGYGPTIEESRDFAAYWKLLEACLESRHEARPVHTAEEISMLARRFPKNIRLHTLSDEEGLQAGICIYDTGRVAHSQYAATTPKARSRYYLTALYHHLMSEVYAEREYFDFGTSNEDGGRVLNAGLLNQKFSMGGTGVAYERYTLVL